MHEAVTIAIVATIYLLPWLIAALRRHNNIAAIVLLNVLLGWTVLGWIVALVWSATDNIRRKNTA